MSSFYIYDDSIQKQPQVLPQPSEKTADEFKTELLDKLKEINDIFLHLSYIYRTFFFLTCNLGVKKNVRLN